MSIASSQKKLLESGLLDQLGTTDRGDSLPNTMKALVEVADFVITQAQKNLNKSGTNATGDLEESIHAEVSSDRAPTIDILLLDRFKFVEYGVKGVKGGKSLKGYAFKTIYPSKKMATSILMWIRKRGIRGRLASQYKPISKTEKKDRKLTEAVNKSDDLKSLAYAMSTAVKRDGIKPVKFMTNAFKEAGREYKSQIAKGLKLDIIENLNDN